MYTSSILWMLSWPVLIILSYQIIKVVVKKYGKKEIPEEDILD